MNYVKITNHDIANGEGVGVVLWLSGCQHHCYNCHNPQTWDPSYGSLFNEDAENQLMEYLHHTYITRITFSGGDPLHPNNIDGVLNLINKIRSVFGDSKTIWLYTGYTFETIFTTSDINHKTRQSIIELCDVLVDGQFVESLKDITLKFRGSSNQRLIDVQQTLDKGEVVLWETE